MLIDPREFAESDSESEASDDREEAPALVSRDNTLWSENIPGPRKFMKHNVLKYKNTGPSQVTKNLDEKGIFELLFPENMVSIIVRETNRKCKALQPHFEEKDMFSSSEIYAFIGLLLHAGVTRSNRENIRDLWATSGHPIFRATMSRNRFCMLLRWIRFDNSATREDRLRLDKAAAISELFMLLNANLVKCYNPSENLTVDEQLYAFRGRTRFTQFIPSKPAKYGIKVWWCNDSFSFYPLQGQIYTGMSSTGERDVKQGERIVKDLCVSLYGGTGRNITCDNFFTTYDLAQSLMTDHNLSLLGTVNKRRRFVPNEFMANKNRVVLSSLFASSNNVTMCSYVPKKNKAVVLLSTSHYTSDVVIEKKSKP